MSRIFQAVVLSGGFGTRLGSVTRELPKPLVPINGRPFLDYLIWNLRRQGITQILLTAGYQSEKLRLYAESISFENLSIEVVDEFEPLGTGGALRNCFDQLADRFLVCNGDTLLDVNLPAFDISSGGRCGLVTREVEDVSQFGAVRVDDGMVRSFNEKGGAGAGLISGGTYIFQKDEVAKLPQGVSSLEHDLLKKLAGDGKLSAFDCDGFFIDIGTPDRLSAAQSLIPEWQRKPIAFLDRDGVLNHDYGHVHEAANFKWTNESREAVRFLNDAGYYTVLVTNQAGIAKGFYDESAFCSLTKWVSDQLWEKGAHLDRVYFCPFHEDGVVQAYKSASYFRKPNPGMLFQAMRELPCNPAGSFMVGDKASDRQAAEAAGVGFCDFQDGSLLATLKKFVDRS